LPQDIAIELAAVASPRWLVLTPLHARACVGARVSLPPLVGVLSATSPLDREAGLALERLSRAPAIEIYGSSETGAIATRRPAYDDRFMPLPGVSVRQTAAGLEVQGGHVTAVTLGDRADIGRDGRFALLGRDEDQVKVGGKRASLSMLNALLRAIPGVLDAEYVQCETGGLAPRLAALVVAPGVRREAILAALRERIDPVFLPRPLHLVDALPRDAIGKIARAALATRVGEIADPDSSDEVGAP
jgi:acyl-coenzyme A synthetase/AMP-(fatty) acid ligase